MKKQIKALFIVLIVLSVLQIVGGIVYLCLTAVDDKRYTDVVCTISEVKTSVSESDEEEDESVTVESIVVTYVNENGETVEATLESFPSSFSVGTKLDGRYKDDPHSITLEKTSWFLPSFILVLGVAYAIGTVVFYLSRKRMGLYALESVSDEYPEQCEEIADDTDACAEEDNPSADNDQTTSEEGNN